MVHQAGTHITPLLVGLRTSNWGHHLVIYLNLDCWNRIQLTFFFFKTEAEAPLICMATTQPWSSPKTR